MRKLNKAASDTLSEIAMVIILIFFFGSILYGGYRWDMWMKKQAVKQALQEIKEGK